MSDIPFEIFDARIREAKYIGRCDVYARSEGVYVRCRNSGKQTLHSHPNTDSAVELTLCKEHESADLRYEDEGYQVV